MNIFYKNTIALTYDEDDDYSETCRLFCYKSALIRNSENSKLIMEIFIPILIEKADEKLSKMEARTL